MEGIDLLDSETSRVAMAAPRKPSAEKSLSVDERLGLDRFEPDDEPFIEVDTELCKQCGPKPCLYVCPAKVYTWENGELVYNIEGCLELGACVVVCKKIGKGAIKWNYPRGGYGIEFRYG
jgi:ferredoxin like protein